MDNYTNIIFNKDNKKIIKSIKRKLKNYQYKNYLLQSLKNFTNGIIYYKSNKIQGFILLEEHIEPSLRPNYIDIMIIYYNSEEIFEYLYNFLNSLLDNNNYYCIEVVPQNYNEYVLFRNKDFFIYNYDYFENIEKIDMIKYIDNKKNEEIYNKNKIYNIYPENGIYNLILKNATF